MKYLISKPSKDLKVSLKHNNLSIQGAFGPYKNKLPLKKIRKNKSSDVFRVSKQFYSEQKSIAKFFKRACYGVQFGYTRQLSIYGIGYKVIDCVNNTLELKLGHSHNIVIKLPESIIVSAKETEIYLLSGNDKVLSFVTDILLRLRPHNKYKKKGIFLTKSSY